jgi:hypothetical protein
VTTSIHTRRRHPERTGGAVVEAALVLPLILLLIGATLELSTSIYLKESLTIAAYEGARLAVTRTADDDRVIERIEEVYAERGISTEGVEIADMVTITPACDTADVLEPVSITVRAPTAGNTVVPFRWMQFITPEELTATVVMRKEYANPGN